MNKTLDQWSADFLESFQDGLDIDDLKNVNPRAMGAILRAFVLTQAVDSVAPDISFDINAEGDADGHIILEWYMEGVSLSVYADNNGDLYGTLLIPKGKDDSFKRQISDVYDVLKDLVVDFQERRK